MTLLDGWKQSRLGELCSIEIGGTPSRGVEAYWDSAHDTSNVWVSIRDMRQRLITGSAEQISDLGVKKSNVKLHQPGTVLLSFKLSIGRVAIAAVPLFTNEAIAGLSPTGLMRDFLFHGLQGWDLLQGVDQAIKGATLNKQKLKKILFEYPESEREQAKIAEVLSTVDRAIEETEALIAKQQRIKTGLMHDLLTRGIDEHGNLRSKQTHEFKDSPLGRIPVEWDPMPFGSCGQWFSGGTPSKAIRRFWGGWVPWVCPKDMKQFELHQSIDTITGDAVAAGARLMPTGTVFIVIRGMILAHTFPVGVSTTEVAFNQDVKAIVPKQGLMGRYLAYWLSSHSHQFLTLATTATHGTKRFDMDELQAALVGVPLPNEQKHIVRIFDEQQSVIERLQGLTAKLQAEKRGLMDDLLTGDRRVTALLGSPRQVVGA